MTPFERRLLLWIVRRILARSDGSNNHYRGIREVFSLVREQWAHFFYEDNVYTRDADLAELFERSKEGTA